MSIFVKSLFSVILCITLRLFVVVFMIQMIKMQVPCPKWLDRRPICICNSQENPIKRWEGNIHICWQCPPSNRFVSFSGLFLFYSVLCALPSMVMVFWWLQGHSCRPYTMKRKMKTGFCMSHTVERTRLDSKSNCCLWFLPLSICDY